MRAWTVLVLLVFLSSGCVDTEERDSLMDEEPVNAMDDATKEKFNQLKEEFERTGEIPDYLLQITITPNPESTFAPQITVVEPPIDYDFTLITQHEEGSTIDANVLVPRNTTSSQVQELLEYFRDVKYKDYINVTLMVYNDRSNTSIPASQFTPDDHNFTGQLNKYSRAKSGPLKDGQIILN